MHIEEKVRGDVERLLSMVCKDKTAVESYEFVLKRLTTMAIRGTMPVNSETPHVREKLYGNDTACADNYDAEEED